MRSITMEKDYTKWYAMNDRDLMKVIGNFIRDSRLDLEMTQSQLSKYAGINRSTLSQVENGVGGTLFTFIRLLRALEKLPLFEHFLSKQPESPDHESVRQRARQETEDDNL